MILMGILLSSYGKEVISLNTTGAAIDLGKKTAAENIKESQENVILFRGSHVAMGIISPPILAIPLPQSRLTQDLFQGAL